MNDIQTDAIRVLDTKQRALLVAVLNRVVPAEGEKPGAGEIGVATAIDHVLAASPTLRRLFLDGLVEIAVESARQADRTFAENDADDQDAVLRAVERAHPLFFSALVEHTYRSYYTHPRVQRAIGHNPRAPQPLGYDLPLFDPSMLERQLQRAPFWRRTD